MELYYFTAFAKKRPVSDRRALKGISRTHLGRRPSSHCSARSDAAFACAMPPESDTWWHERVRHERVARARWHERLARGGMREWHEEARLRCACGHELGSGRYSSYAWFAMSVLLSHLAESQAEKQTLGFTLGPQQAGQGMDRGGGSDVPPWPLFLVLRRQRREACALRRARVPVGHRRRAARQSARAAWAAASRPASVLGTPAWCGLGHDIWLIKMLGQSSG